MKRSIVIAVLIISSCASFAQTKLLIGRTDGKKDTIALNAISQVRFSPSTLPPSLDEQVRSNALSGVEAAFSSVAKLSISEGNAALVLYLHTRPEFAASGIADSGGNVWARFTDGRLLIIANNRTVSEDTTSPSPSISHSNILNKTSDDNMPVSKKARVMNAMGTWFTDPSPVLSGMLTSRGYTVNVQQGTVENLGRVSGDGIFYFDSHGGNGWRRDSSSIIALWTATPRTPQLDTAYKLMLDADELCYVTAKNNLVTHDSATIETHYGITGEFVINHMSFGQDCLIYIDACRSFVGDFISSFIDKSPNASGTFISWSNYVDDSKAYKVMKFVFDRLLGTNISYVPWVEHPPQRPFGIEKIWTDMGSRTPPVNRYADNSVSGNVQIATLEYRIGGGSKLGILAPSIKFLTVDESTQKMTLNGIFGPDPKAVVGGTGSVTIDSIVAPYTSWTKSTIECTIPKSGRGSAGDVIVTAFGHPSNTVQLTEWRGTLTFNQPAIGSQGTFYRFNLHFRADVHSFREQPGGTPKPVTRADVRFMEDSNGEFTIGGDGKRECTQYGCSTVATETWISSSLSIPMWTGLAGGITGFSGSASIFPNEKKVNLHFGGGVGKGLFSHVKLKTTCPDTAPSTVEWDSEFSDLISMPSLGYIPMTINDSYVIQSGQLNTTMSPRGQIVGFCVTQPVADTTTISWTDFTPTWAPSRTAAR
jgi:hypothetical protein